MSPFTERTRLLNNDVENDVEIPMPDLRLRIPTLKCITGCNLRSYRQLILQHGTAPHFVLHPTRRPLTPRASRSSIRSFELARANALIGLDELEQHLLELTERLLSRRTWKIYMLPVASILILIFLDIFALTRPEDGLSLGAVAVFVGVSLCAWCSLFYNYWLYRSIYKTRGAKIRVASIAARVRVRDQVDGEDVAWIERHKWSGVSWHIIGL